jgi:hypothetical protein
LLLAGKTLKLNVQFAILLPEPLLEGLEIALRNPAVDGQPPSPIVRWPE